MSAKPKDKEGNAQQKGREQRFTYVEVIDAVKKGRTPTGAAALLKCHPDTIRNYARRYRSVKDALESEREGLIDLAELGLRAALLREEAWAVAFTLRTLGSKHGYAQREETLEGKVDLSSLTDDQLQRLSQGENLISVLTKKK